MMPTITLKAYEYIAGIIAIIVICGSLWLAGDWHGHKVVQAQWDAANHAQIVSDLNTVHASDIVTTIRVTQFVDRYNLVLTAGATITKEITHVITPEVDRSYLVPVGLVRLYNAGSGGQTMDTNTTGRTDDSAAPVELSYFATGIVSNLTTCRANAQQLESLQQWIRGQQEVTKKAP